MIEVITTENDPQGILRKGSVRVEHPTSVEMRSLVADMVETMYQSDGEGLAAPQIGRNIRLFVIRSGGRVSVFFNPNILSRSERTSFSEEGCLSIPGTYYNIERSDAITVEFQDIEGKKCRLDADGFLAVVIQHEYDHLQGILIEDRYRNQSVAAR